MTGLAIGTTYHYRVKSKNAAGTLATSADLTFATSARPVPSIAAPLASLKYKVGDVIAYSGSATDAEDGAIPASGLSWQVLIQHCPGGVCRRPRFSSTGATGSFPVTDLGDDRYFEIVLTATDSSGLTNSTSVSILPQTVQLTLSSSPSGLQLVLDGATVTTPNTRTTVVGSAHTLNAPSPQGASTSRPGPMVAPSSTPSPSAQAT